MQFPQKIPVIGISRENEFSPNNIENDAAILNATAEELNKLGCKVRLYTEKEFVTQRIQANFIFSMARNQATISRLKELENTGVLVINSGYGVENCIRQTMTELLLAHRVPHPQSQILSTDKGCLPVQFPCWLKRGNSHAMVKEDVVYINNQGEAEQALTSFRERHIPRVVVNEHLTGDLVKFYGVQDTDFFYYFYPTCQSYSKFGLEAMNGKNHAYPFDAMLLKKYANQAAQALNVQIYGGDCIVSSTGETKIIDFNDWPSFARCRKEASYHIAAKIYNSIISKLNIR